MPGEIYNIFPLPKRRNGLSMKLYPFILIHLCGDLRHCPSSPSVLCVPSGAEVTDCGQYLLVTTQQDCRDNLLYFAPLPPSISDQIALTCIVDTFEADYEVGLCLLEVS